MIHTLYKRPIYIVDDICLDEIDAIRERCNQTVDENPDMIYGNYYNRGIKFISHRVMNAHEDPAFYNLSEQLLIHAHEFAQEIGYDQKLRVVNSWFNFCEEGNYMQQHVHRDALISCVYYAQVDHTSKLIVRGDFLNMHPYPTRQTDWNTNFKEFDTITGRAIFFMSDTAHGFDRLDGDKISFSFNYSIDTQQPKR